MNTHSLIFVTIVVATLCYRASCNQKGRCCMGSTCNVTLPDACTGKYGGQFGGVGTDCSGTDPCKGACCQGSSCTLQIHDDCASGGAGTFYFWGQDTKCDTVPGCQGACCFGTEYTCGPFDLSSLGSNGCPAPGIYAGPKDCNKVICPTDGGVCCLSKYADTCNIASDLASCNLDFGTYMGGSFASCDACMSGMCCNSFLPMGNIKNAGSCIGDFEVFMGSGTDNCNALPRNNETIRTDIEACLIGNRCINTYYDGTGTQCIGSGYGPGTTCDTVSWNADVGYSSTSQSASTRLQSIFFM